MRIPSGSTDRVIFFVAVDSTDLKTRETGRTGWTVYYSLDDAGSATAMTTPTVTEIDGTNMPGVYSLLLDESGMTTLTAGHDTEELSVHVTQADIAPVTRTIEIYRPETTQGNTLGVAATGDISGNVDGNVDGSVASVSGAVGSVTGAVGSVTGAVGSVTGAVGSVSGNVDGSTASVTGAVGSVTGAVGSVTGAVASVTADVGITQAGADKVWSSATRTLTAFSTALALSVWDVLESAIVTASSIGLKLKTNLDAAITSRSSHSAADAGTDAAGKVLVTPAQKVVTDASGYVTAESVTGAVGSVTGAVGSVSGNVDGSVASVTGAVGSVTGAVGSVTGAVGSVTAAVGITSNVKKNQALANFEYMMTDSTNHLPSTGLTVTATRSIDGGAFAAGTLANVTEVASGIYRVDFGAGDLNGDVITLRCTAASSDDTFVTLITSP